MNTNTIPTFEQVRQSIRRAWNLSLPTSPAWTARREAKPEDAEEIRRSCEILRTYGGNAIRTMEMSLVGATLSFLQRAVDEERAYGEPEIWAEPLALATELARSLDALPPAVHRGPFKSEWRTEPFAVVSPNLTLPCRTREDAIRMAQAASNGGTPMVGVYGPGVHNILAVAVYHGPSHSAVIVEVPK